MYRKIVHFVLCSVIGIFVSLVFILKPASHALPIMSFKSHDIISRIYLKSTQSLTEKDTAQSKQSNIGPSVQVDEVTVAGTPILKASVDLNDPETIFIVVPVEEVERIGGFTQFARSSGAALVLNTTFKDASKRNWTKISQGSVIEGEASMNWTTGTVLSLSHNNFPEMIDRVEGPDWRNYWFAVTSEPRLIKNGEIVDTSNASPYLNSRVFQRSAIGFSRNTNTLYHVITDERDGKVSLPQLATIMQSLGCDEAVNLEGGDGVLLSHGNTIHINDVELHNQPVRAPVIVVYNRDYPAPREIRASWQRFHDDLPSATHS